MAAPAPEVFQWLRKPGHALAALVPPRCPVAPPLVAEELETGAVAAWLPLRRRAAGLRALLPLPADALLLVPAEPAQVPRFVDTWLRLYAEAPKGIEEAFLQVNDDAVHFRDYLAAEELIWKLVYAAHPHREDPGIMPRALKEARWLADLVVEDKRFASRSEFLTLEAFAGLARGLLLTVRKAELQNLREHLHGRDTVLGW